MSIPDAPTRARPRGLWKGRGTPKPNKDFNLDDHRPAKRQRLDNASDASSDDLGYYIIECTPEPSNHSDDEDEEMDSPDTVVDPENFAMWEQLKGSFATVVEQYESDNVDETLSLLRGVLDECHRFLRLYKDPSVLFATPGSRTPEALPSSPANKPPRKCKCRESPTAFHALLGTALFLMGNLVAQDPSIVLPKEPVDATTYWLAALDVFEMGENLPSRTSGRGCEAPEDWRMALVWGRTLLCVADAALRLQQQQQSLVHPQSMPPEPKWPSSSTSVFAVIAMRRSPACRRVNLASTPPDELLLLAMDHFTRGIFLMPHANPPAQNLGDRYVHPPPFSRSAELFTIAHEVLSIAERLSESSERMRWATWADSVLNQVPTQTSVVARARGRCWLVVGTAHVEALEALAETQGWNSQDSLEGVLDCEDADDTREALERAVEFFERATADETPAGEDEQDSELLVLYTEALLTLANFSKDEAKQEMLYQRAASLGVSLEGMDVDEA